MSSRHAYDRDPTTDDPIVRVYPAIPWLHSKACWVVDDGQDTMGQHILGEFNRGVSHFIADDQFFGETCDTCKKRRAYSYDDFFGYLCPLCVIKYPLRYKQRNINPWTGSELVPAGSTK